MGVTQVVRCYGFDAIKVPKRECGLEKCLSVTKRIAYIPVALPYLKSRIHHMHAQYHFCKIISGHAAQLESAT